MESIPDRKSQQIIVMLVENIIDPSDALKSTKTFLLDKIRFDFTDKAVLKLVTLKLHSENVFKGMPECVELISQSVYASGTMHLNHLETVIRRLDAQRSSPEWNFNNFFLVKESKALALTKLGLLEDALLCYDELEAIFYSNSNTPSKALDSDSCHGNDLYDLKSKPYRDRIMHNEASNYEFLVYLHTCQSNLLLTMGKISEYLKRSKKFICFLFVLQDFTLEKRREWIFDAITTSITYAAVKNGSSFDDAITICDLFLLAYEQVNNIRIILIAN